ncbi:BQ2448_2188 [Microbotryum intermedium]|uniref:BQ2448_2188 protein n=1 Tax=Microbotryum intermedium TaxID=269621 RepID=A0A238FDE8_9BASI|nr:BQ2448_2188 [Microbotryum intermedium]
MVRPGGESIVPLFPLLSSHDLPTRIDASVSLLSSLALVQAATSSTVSTPLDSPRASTSTKSALASYDDGADSDDVDTPYAIKRLVAGLGSTNEASRQGFAVALTEVISRLPFSKASTILAQVLASSAPTGSTDPREERGMLFARLLGIHAVVRSGILFHPQQRDPEQFREAVLALVQLAMRKMWMREPAWWVVLEAIRALIDAAPSWIQEAQQWLVQRLLIDSREKSRGFTPEKVALVLTLQKNGVEADWSTVLAPTFPSGNVLARSSLTALAQALKGGAGEAASSSSNGPTAGSNDVKVVAKNGAPLPGTAPHFVWNEIFDAYFPASGTAPKLAGNEPIAKWNDAWRVLVDQSLFAPPSLPLKATGFSLLSLAMQRLPPSDVPALFGEGVVRTFTNHLRKTGETEKTLSRVADKLALSIPPFLANNPSVAFPLLKTLIAPPHGQHTFDAKTIEKVVAKFDLKSVRGWISYLKEFILGNSEQEEGEGSAIGLALEPEQVKALAARRTWAFDQLLHLVRSTAVAKDDEIIASVLEFFAVLGWFDVRKSGKGARSYVATPALTESLRLAARSRFFSVLTVLAPSPAALVSTKTAATPAATTATWLSRALALLENLAADSKHFTPVDEADDDVESLRANIKKLYARLDAKKSSAEDERVQTAKALIEGVTLLSFDEGEDSIDTLESLSDALPFLFPNVITNSDAASRKSAQDDEDDEMANEEDGEAPEPATVLVDLLLELLRRPSAFVKGVAQHAFVGFSQDLGPQAMELLLEQIRPEVSERTENEVDADGDASMTAEQGAKVNGKSPAASRTAAVAEESEDEDDDDSDDSDVDVDEDFKNELLAALQASGVADEIEANEQAAEHKDDDESSDEEELLDDDAMMALDDKLADIFRLQSGSSGRRSKKLDRTDDMHYHLRVLDLVDALAKHRSASPLLVLVVLPLLGIVRSTSALEMELQTKAGRTLRSIVQNKREVVPLSTPDAALEALEELHQIAAGVDSAELASLCSQTAIYLVKSALASAGSDASTASTISKLYNERFSDYLVKKNSKTKVQPTLTTDFCKRSPVCAWPLFDAILDLSQGDVIVNVYRRMQAFEVLHTLVTSYVAQSSKTPETTRSLLSKSLPRYRQTLLSVFVSAADPDKPTASLDASRLKDVVKFALAGVRLTKNLDAAQAKDVWQVESWIKAREGLKASDRFKSAAGVHNSLKQLIATIEDGSKTGKRDQGNAAGKKRKAGADQPAPPTNEGKQSKKTKSTLTVAHAAPVVKEVAAEAEVEVEDDEEIERAAAALSGAPSEKGAKVKKSKKYKKRKASE